MSFDPTLPKANTKVRSSELRNQFNGLKSDYEAKIAAIPAGPPGPPFATAIVDAVNTLEPDDAATVVLSFDGTKVHFTFGVPRGHDGATGGNGDQGPEGPQGEKGDQGDPGEVSTQQLNNAVDGGIAGTARNPSGIDAFGGTFSNPPTQAEMQAFADYVESFRQAVVR